jgi:chromate transporter
MIQTLMQLFGMFVLLSLLAVGGGNGIIPAMQHSVVDVHHWMTDREFLDLFAISRVVPGPGSLIVILVGQKVAGLPGAVVAAVATYAPSCLLVHAAARVWDRYESAAWRYRMEQSLAPVAIGLTFASVLALLRAEHDPVSWIITVGAGLILTVTELSPILVLGAAAGLALLFRG